VSVTGDTIVESNETFNVLVSNATGGATIGTPTSVMTIVDDDIGSGLGAGGPGPGTGGGSGAGTTQTGTQATQISASPTLTEPQIQAQPQQPQIAPADTTPPRFTGALNPQSTRRTLVVELGSSEKATLQVTVFRRLPGGRSFIRIRQVSLKLKRGRNVVTLLRSSSGALRAGSYRVRLRLVDAAGNKSFVQTLYFELS
jgi:hypothetical protein